MGCSSTDTSATFSAICSNELAIITPFSSLLRYNLHHPEVSPLDVIPCTPPKLLLTSRFTTPVLTLFPFLLTGLTKDNVEPQWLL